MPLNRSVGTNCPRISLSKDYHSANDLSSQVPLSCKRAGEEDLERKSLIYFSCSSFLYML